MSSVADVIGFDARRLWVSSTNFTNSSRRSLDNPIEADHGRLKARLRSMRGLERLRSAAVIAAGHAFVQNLRRGFYELGLDLSPRLRLATAFTELAQAL